MPITAEEAFGKRADKLPTAESAFGKKTSPSIGEAAKSIFTSVPKAAEERGGFVANKVGSISDLAAADAKEELRKWQGRRSDVDYETGLPMAAEIAFSRADNDRERELALKKSFPEGKIDRDEQGNFIVLTPDGKKIAAGVGGSFFRKKVPTFFASQAEPIIGMGAGAIAGGAAGAPFAPITFGLSVPIGAILGAGAGGFGGKAIQEVEKRVTGYSDKDIGETQEILTSEAGWSMAGEGVGKVLLGLGRASRRFPKIFGEQSPETIKLTEESIKAGAKPPISAIAPGATKTPYMQSYIEKVIGNHRETKNMRALEGQIRQSLQSAGFSTEQADKSMADLLSGKVSSRAYGEEMTKAVKRYVELQEISVRSLGTEMNKILDSQYKQIEKEIGSPDPKLSELVKTDIETARETFSLSATEMYSKVDNLVGKEPLVPTERLKAQAKSIVESFPATEKGERIIAPGAESVVKYLNDLANLPENISFSQAQFLRSEFNRMAMPTDLTPGVDKRLFGNLARAVNGSFDDAKTGIKTKKAAEALKTADQFYRENIIKFKNTMAVRLTKEAGEKGSVDPESVISLVARPGYESRLKYIMKMVNPQTQKAIVAEDFAQMISRSADPATKEISGKALLRQLKSREKTGEILYGKQWPEIKKYAARIAAKDGELSLEGLTPDQFTETLKKKVFAQDELEKFMNRGENYLATLAKNDFESRDAINFIVQPGKEQRLERAINFFGENSPIVKNLRKQSLLKIFSDAGGDSTEPMLKALQGDKLLKEINKYSDRQLAMLFPNGLDLELKNMAEVVKFYSSDVTRSGGDIAAGLAAGATKLTPAYYPIAVVSYIADSVLQNPKVLRWFGPGLYGDNAATVSLREFFRNVPRSYIQSYAGPDDE